MVSPASPTRMDFLTRLTDFIPHLTSASSRSLVVLALEMTRSTTALDRRGDQIKAIGVIRQNELRLHAPGARRRGDFGAECTTLVLEFSHEVFLEFRLDFLTGWSAVVGTGKNNPHVRRPYLSTSKLHHGRVD